MAGEDRDKLILELIAKLDKFIEPLNQAVSALNNFSKAAATSFRTAASSISASSKNIINEVQAIKIRANDLRESLKGLGHEPTELFKGIEGIAPRLEAAAKSGGLIRLQSEIKQMATEAAAASATVRNKVARDFDVLYRLINRQAVEEKEKNNEIILSAEKRSQKEEAIRKTAIQIEAAYLKEGLNAEAAAYRHLHTELSGLTDQQIIDTQRGLKSELTSINEVIATRKREKIELDRLNAQQQQAITEVRARRDRELSQEQNVFSTLKRLQGDLSQDFREKTEQIIKDIQKRRATEEEAARQLSILHKKSSEEFLADRQKRLEEVRKRRDTEIAEEGEVNSVITNLRRDLLNKSEEDERLRLRRQAELRKQALQSLSGISSNFGKIGQGISEAVVDEEEARIKKQQQLREGLLNASKGFNDKFLQSSLFILNEKDKAEENAAKKQKNRIIEELDLETQRHATLRKLRESFFAAKGTGNDVEAKRLQELGRQVQAADSQQLASFRRFAAERKATFAEEYRERLKFLRDIEQKERQLGKIGGSDNLRKSLSDLGKQVGITLTSNLAPLKAQFQTLTAISDQLINKTREQRLLAQQAIAAERQKTSAANLYASLQTLIIEAKRLQLPVDAALQQNLKYIIGKNKEDLLLLKAKAAELRSQVAFAKANENNDSTQGQQKGLDKVLNKLKSISGIIVGGGIFATIGAGFIDSAINKITTLTERFRQLGEETNLTGTQVQQLDATFRQFGVNEFQLERSLRQFGERLQEVREGGITEIDKGFSDLGITYQDLQKTNFDEIKSLELLSTKLHDTEDATLRNNSAARLLGRGSVQVADALLQLGGNVSKVAASMKADLSEDQIKVLNKLALEWESLGLKIQIAIAKTLLVIEPAFTKIINLVTQAANGYQRLLDMIEINNVTPEAITNAQKQVGFFEKELLNTLETTKDFGDNFVKNGGAADYFADQVLRAKAALELLIKVKKQFPEEASETKKLEHDLSILNKFFEDNGNLRQKQVRDESDSNNKRVKNFQDMLQAETQLKLDAIRKGKQITIEDVNNFIRGEQDKLNHLGLSSKAQVELESKLANSRKELVKALDDVLISQEKTTLETILQQRRKLLDDDKALRDQLNTQSLEQNMGQFADQEVAVSQKLAEGTLSQGQAELELHKIQQARHESVIKNLGDENKNNQDYYTNLIKINNDAIDQITTPTLHSTEEVNKVLKERENLTKQLSQTVVKDGQTYIQNNQATADRIKQIDQDVADFRAYQSREAARKGIEDASTVTITTISQREQLVNRLKELQGDIEHSTKLKTSAEGNKNETEAKRATDALANYKEEYNRIQNELLTIDRNIEQARSTVKDAANKKDLESTNTRIKKANEEREAQKENLAFIKQATAEKETAISQLDKFEKSIAEDSVSKAEEDSQTKIDTFNKYVSNYLDALDKLQTGDKERAEAVQRILKDEATLRDQITKQMREASVTEFDSLFDFLKEQGQLSVGVLDNLKETVGKDISSLAGLGGAAVLNNKEFRDLIKVYEKVNGELDTLEGHSKKTALSVNEFFNTFDPGRIASIEKGADTVKILAEGFGQIFSTSGSKKSVFEALGINIAPFEQSLKGLVQNFTGSNGLAVSSGNLKLRFDSVSESLARFGAQLDKLNGGITKRSIDVGSVGSTNPFLVDKIGSVVQGIGNLNDHIKSYVDSQSLGPKYSFPRAIDNPGNQGSMNINVNVTGSVQGAGQQIGLEISKGIKSNLGLTGNVIPFGLG